MSLEKTPESASVHAAVRRADLIERAAMLLLSAKLGEVNQELVSAGPLLASEFRSVAWPQRCVQRAFVDGAKWWECESTGGTMWQSDQAKAEYEAINRFGEPS
jgi:hypothetical protein